MSISEQLREALDKSVADFKRFFGDREPQWPVERMYRHGEAWFAHWKRMGCSDAEARAAVRGSCRPRFAVGGTISASGIVVGTITRDYVVNAEQARRLALHHQEPSRVERERAWMEAFRPIP